MPVPSAPMTYQDGFRDGWQFVTDAPYDRWPTGGAGYESGVEDGKREAEAMMRKRYSPRR